MGATEKRSAMVAKGPRYRGHGVRTSAPAAAGGDRPGHLELGEAAQQVTGARKWTDVPHPPDEGVGVLRAKPPGILGAQPQARFAEQGVHEQAAAHPDPPMDFPDRELHPGTTEHLVPCEHVLVHAVDQGPVEVEQHRRSPFTHKSSVAWQSWRPSDSLTRV